MTNKITELSTDVSNPEQQNPRYYRTWWQRKLASLFKINMDEPQHHANSKHFIWRHFARLQQLKRSHPKTALFLQYFIPFVALALIPFVWFVLPHFIALSVALLVTIQVTTSVVSLIVSLLAVINKWVGDNVFGEPLKSFEHLYEHAASELYKTYYDATDGENRINDGLKMEVYISPKDDQSSIVFTKGTARGVLTIKKGSMPKLSIKADNHTDAGYLEGYMQGEQMDIPLQQINYLYGIIRRAIGAPADDKDLAKYLAAIEKTLPQYYIDEMKAKVAGYNQWRSDKGLPKSGQLEYYKYLLLQLMPDTHHYNPFSSLNPKKTEAPNELNTDLAPGCTTVAFKVGEYTCYVRVLDWPGYNVAGKSFIELERDVKGYKKITDTSLSLLSGCVTALNEHDVLTQINVSRVKKVGPKGMPGAFFIRYLAERCSDINQMKTLVKEGDTYIKSGPLSGMHVSATDGKETISLHMEQAENEGHVLEKMGERPLVVPNFGYDPVTKELIDHHDSCARLENVNYFFKHHPKEHVLSGKVNEKEQLAALREYMSMIMKLDLIDNCESVFAGMYIYKNNKLIDCRASTDNSFAGSRSVDEMYHFYTCPS